ncbi:MAG: transposase [Verrucomicrobiales bacterium]
MAALLVEIETNLIENVLRRIAVGRDNWIFLGSREAGGAGPGFTLE